MKIEVVIFRKLVYYYYRLVYYAYLKGCGDYHRKLLDEHIFYARHIINVMGQGILSDAPAAQPPALRGVDCLDSLLRRNGCGVYRV